MGGALSPIEPQVMLPVADEAWTGSQEVPVQLLPSPEHTLRGGLGEGTVGLGPGLPTAPCPPTTSYLLQAPAEIQRLLAGSERRLRAMDSPVIMQPQPPAMPSPGWPPGTASLDLRALPPQGALEGTVLPAQELTGAMRSSSRSWRPAPGLGLQAQSQQCTGASTSLFLGFCTCITCKRPRG